MTTGVLIFAYNNEHIDYLAMANWSAKNIRRHLNLPVAVVTNIPPPSDYKFEQTIIANTIGKYTRKFNDLPENVTWYNGNRVDAYSLSPWARTLVLDADYIVASTQLKSILTVNQDFLAHKTAIDITNDLSFDEHNYFGRNRMPMWWATVMMFRKSNTAQYIFDCMSMIRANWRHYKDLYHITGTNYRNDYALSIALGIVSGHTLQVDNIPFRLASVMPEHKLTQLDEDFFQIEYPGEDKRPKKIAWAGTDFHAMGKKHLGDIIANSR